MMKKTVFLSLMILLLGAASAAGVGGCTGQKAPPSSLPNLSAPNMISPDFRRADGPREWSFPADYGAHPAYQTEWWYYTGNLETAGGRQFGYQLTLFRRGILPPDQIPARDSAWSAEEIYMGHLALTDAAGREHHGFEKFSRGAAGLAGARSDPFAVWLEHWEIREIGPETYQVRAGAGDIHIDLILKNRKGLTFHGQNGFSQKGSQPGNASYYFSQTRLATRGEVQASGISHQVSGLSWMDHEFSTSVLSPNQVGWDWFSIQLDEGTDLMTFQIRRQDGSVDPYSSGTLIEPSGSTRHLDQDDFTITVTDTWRSPRTGADYPAGWVVEVPAADLSLRIVPVLPDQEMNVSYVYWEGAVRVEGQISGQVVEGKGYAELTGYLESMAGEF